MAESEEELEQTLHIARAVNVYRIPPRPGANGWRSGEWLVSDRLFSGRMRIVAKGELCEIRLEDPNTGDLFVMCPVQYGQRNVCVESVTDSSRYYVLRVEDPGTHRHAFLGMGFDNRSDAFDFNEALVRHEQQVARERAARAKAAEAGHAASPSGGGGACPGGGPAGGRQQWAAGSAAAANSSAAAEVEALHRHTAGLKLQEGQTIRVNVSGIKKSTGSPAAAAGTGFLAGAKAAMAPPLPMGPARLSGSGVLLAPPPPSAPPAATAAAAAAPLIARVPPPPPATTASSVGASSALLILPDDPQPHVQQAPAPPWGIAAAAAPPQPVQPTPQPAGVLDALPHLLEATTTPPVTSPGAAGQDNWATFD